MLETASETGGVRRLGMKAVPNERGAGAYALPMLCRSSF